MKYSYIINYETYTLLLKDEMIL